MGAAEDVDRVELEEADVVDRPSQVPGGHPPGRPRAAESLGGEGEAPRLLGAEVEIGIG